MFCISPWLFQYLRTNFPEMFPELLTLSVLLAPALGFVSFFVYFSLYHIPYEKQAMQMVERRYLQKLDKPKVSEWIKQFFCERNQVSAASATIWYFIDINIKNPLNTWLRHTFAVLHSLGACLVSIVAAFALIYSGILFSPEIVSQSLAYGHVALWAIVSFAFLIYRIHYKKRYMQRLQLLIKENRKKISRRKPPEF